MSGPPGPEKLQTNGLRWGILRWAGCQGAPQFQSLTWPFVMKRSTAAHRIDDGVELIAHPALDSERAVLFPNKASGS